MALEPSESILLVRNFYNFAPLGKKTKKKCRRIVNKAFTDFIQQGDLKAQTDFTAAMLGADQKDTSRYFSPVLERQERAYQKICKLAWMQKADSKVEHAVSYAQGSDPQFPIVVDRELKAGDLLFQMQLHDRVNGDFFTGIIWPPDKIGIDGVAKARKDGRILKKQIRIYCLNTNFTFKESVSGKIVDAWSNPDQPKITNGGGIQYFTEDKNVADQVGVIEVPFNFFCKDGSYDSKGFIAEVIKGIEKFRRDKAQQPLLTAEKNQLREQLKKQVREQMILFDNYASTACVASRAFENAVLHSQLWKSRTSAEKKSFANKYLDFAIAKLNEGNAAETMIYFRLIMKAITQSSHGARGKIFKFPEFRVPEVQAKAYLYYAIALNKQGYHKHALYNLEKCREFRDALTPKQKVLLEYHHAVASMNTVKANEAIGLFNNALELFQQNLEAFSEQEQVLFKTSLHLDRGRAYAQIDNPAKDYKQAIEHLEAAKALLADQKPQPANYWICLEHLGFSYIYNREYNKAAKVFDECFRADLSSLPPSFAETIKLGKAYTHYHLAVKIGEELIKEQDEKQFQIKLDHFLQHYRQAYVLAQESYQFMTAVPNGMAAKCMLRHTDNSFFDLSGYKFINEIFINYETLAERNPNFKAADFVSKIQSSPDGAALITQVFPKILEFVHKINNVELAYLRERLKQNDPTLTLRYPLIFKQPLTRQP